MSDLLDFQPARRPAHPSRRLPKPVGLAVVFVVLLAVIGGIALGGKALVGSFTGVPDYKGAGAGAVVVQILVGQSAGAIGATLAGKDVVKSAKAFRRAAAAEPRSLGLQPGYYSLRARMSAQAALLLLLDPTARLRGRVVLPEGMPLANALDLIAKGTQVSIADLKSAAANPAGLGLPGYAKGQLEGFLFPATYDVEPGTSAVQVLSRMVQRYGDAAAEVDLVAGAARLGRTPYEVLIVASLIEKETAFAGDRAKVARVVYNRLRLDMRLQFDSTLNYVRAERTARLTIKDLAVESPYNTYLHKGLPPTPIDSPGRLALEAALNPASGDYVYFVTISKDGRSLFTKSYDAFLAAKAKSQRDGVY